MGSQFQSKDQKGNKRWNRVVRIDKRSIKVIITGYAKKEFDKLNKIVGEEIKNGITKSDNQILLSSIKQKIDLLKENPLFGINISKDRIPKKYVLEFCTNNLWKINLSNAWRMIYTINGDKVEIICIILDVLDHKTYSNKFGYKK